MNGSYYLGDLAYCSCGDAAYLVRLDILGGGILPYMAALVAYDLAVHPDEALDRGLYAALLSIGVIAVAWLGRGIQSRWGHPSRPPTETGWGTAVFMLAVGILVVLVELAVFPA